MTQEELSERARISVSFLSMIERGERAPHLETLAAIADALDVRLAELFAEGQESAAPDPVYGALIEACRRHNLDKRDVDLLVSMMRSMSLRRDRRPGGGCDGRRRLDTPR